MLNNDNPIINNVKKAVIGATLIASTVVGLIVWALRQAIDIVAPVLIFMNCWR